MAFSGEATTTTGRRGSGASGRRSCVSCVSCGSQVLDALESRREEQKRRQRRAPHKSLSQNRPGRQRLLCLLSPAMATTHRARSLSSPPPRLLTSSFSPSAGPSPRQTEQAGLGTDRNRREGMGGVSVGYRA